MANAIRKTTTSIAMKMPTKHVDSESQVSTAVDLGTCIIDIGSMCKRGQLNEALGVLHQMNQKGISVDFNTYASLLQACGNAKTLTQGYAQHGPPAEALNLLHQMQVAGMTPDMVTLTSVLPACAHLAALQQGKEIHDYVIRRGFEFDVIVMSALIDMYAKCGIVKFARHLFDRMPRRDVVSWNSMILAYGMHGYGKDALVLFDLMQQADAKPNRITFINVLSACSHAGLLDEGFECFGMIQDYGITPSLEHYACIVDLLGRAGRLDEAHDFIKRMPVQPDVDLWGALLGACKIHGNIELGEHVAACILHLEPENTGHYILLSNTYAASGRWDDVEKVRKMMKGRCLKKTPGCSFIEVDNKVHGFLAEDR